MKVVTSGTVHWVPLPTVLVIVEITSVYAAPTTRFSAGITSSTDLLPSGPGFALATGPRTGAPLAAAIGAAAPTTMIGTAHTALIADLRDTLLM